MKKIYLLAIASLLFATACSERIETINKNHENAVLTTKTAEEPEWRDPDDIFPKQKEDETEETNPGDNSDGEVLDVFKAVSMGFDRNQIFYQGGNFKIYFKTGNDNIKILNWKASQGNGNLIIKNQTVNKDEGTVCYTGYGNLQITVDYRYENYEASATFSINGIRPRVLTMQGETNAYQNRSVYQWIEHTPGDYTFQWQVTNADSYQISGNGLHFSRNTPGYVTIKCTVTGSGYSTILYSGATFLATGTNPGDGDISGPIE